MASIDLNDDNFRETYSKHNIVVIDFWAPWCGPCQSFGPIFEEVSEVFPKTDNLIFGKVNTEQEQGISNYFQIRSIPTLIVIREGIEIFRHSGAISSTELKQIVEKSQEVDMNEVNKIIDKEDAAAEAKSETKH